MRRYRRTGSIVSHMLAETCVFFEQSSYSAGKKFLQIASALAHFLGECFGKDAEDVILPRMLEEDQDCESCA